MKEFELKFEGSFVTKLHNMLVDAKLNCHVLLDEHDAKLGRTTRKNKAIAEMYEEEIKKLETAIHEIGKKLAT